MGNAGISFISCVGMVTPVGYTSQATSAALRAGISGFQELLYRERSGDKVIGAFVPAVRLEICGKARLTALANLLFQTLQPEFVEALPWTQVPVFVCLPENQRPGPRLSEIAANVKLPNNNVLKSANTTYIEGGPTSAYAAINEARNMIEHAGVSSCLVLAIDTMIDARVLNWLDQACRLKTSTQTDGVIPGEAACLALVSSRRIASTCAALLGLGLAWETATVLNEEAMLGKGLARAVQVALREAGIEMHDVDFRVSDVAGESYAFEELVIAQTRLMRRVRPEQPLWHPADCVGDCGAAAGLIQFAWVEQSFARDYAPGPIAALHGSSAFGARAAAIVGSSKEGQLQ
jgi:3-oxoacyl-[acyl-carrier-protein] synthase-1